MLHEHNFESDAVFETVKPIALLILHYQSNTADFNPRLQDTVK